MPKASQASGKKTKPRKNAKSVKAVAIRSTIPQAVAVVSKNGAPRIVPGKHGIRIQHRELISTLEMGPNFSWFTFHYSIQPGLNSSFPWLSGLAVNFERYRFHNLRYRYVPIAGTNTMGSVTIVVDYDPRDHTDGGEAITRPMLMQNETCVTSPMWKESSVTCDKQALLSGMTTKFVRAFAVDPVHATSIRSSDCGEVIFGTYRPPDYTGSTLSSVFGDVWAEYDVELITPCPNQVLPTSSFTAAPVSGYYSPALSVPAPGTTAYYSDVKQEGPGIGSYGIQSTDPSNLDVTWNLQDLIPNAMYWFEYTVNEAASGVSDAISFVSSTAMTWINNPAQKTSTVSGGTVTIRTMFKALDAIASIRTHLATSSGAASQITGTIARLIPIFDQASPWKNFG